MVLFFKSLVHTHNRRNQDGSVSVVNQHTDSRKGTTHKVGAPVHFKPADGKSYRGGTIVGVGSANYKVEGKRNNAGVKEVHVIPKHLVLSLEEYESQKAKASAGSETREAISSTKRVISVKEGQRRKEAGLARLGISDNEILANPKIVGRIHRDVGRLARGTSLVQNKTSVVQNGFIQADDPEYADSLTEYSMAMLNSIHHEAETASDADLQEFKRYLTGELQSSRIFWTASKAGKNAAMHFMNNRIERQKEETSIDMSDLEDAGTITAFSTPANQEKDLRGTVETGIDRALSKLPAFDAELLRMKFGLGNLDPHTNDQISAILNRDGHKYQDKYKWDRNNVGAATQAAILNLKSVAGIDELRDFLKSLKGHITLKKAEVHQKTICIDFDGVIADYAKGFLGQDVFGELLKDDNTGMTAADVLPEYKAAGWKIIIFTTRPDTPALRQYLADNNIPYDEINHNSEQPEGSNPGKPIADIYLDDRAEKFTKWAKAIKLAHLKKSLTNACLVAEICDIGNRICAVFPNGARLTKSFSADLATQFPDGQLITLENGPLANRKLFVLQKSHNKGYTDKNGRVVTPYDDSRPNRPIDYRANPKEDIEHSIQRGTNAMNHVIQHHADVKNAMHREGIGSISFYWGEKGDPDKKYKGGSGIAHIIARRDWEARHVPELKDQKGVDVAHQMVEVIARGEKVREWGPDGGQRIELAHNGHTAVLSRYRQGQKETWLLTGWRNNEAPGETGGVYDPASSTLTETTRFHSGEVAGATDKKLTKAEGICNIKMLPSLKSSIAISEAKRLQKSIPLFIGGIFLAAARKVVP